MTRRMPRELSGWAHQAIESGFYAFSPSKETQHRWLRKGGKRRVRRMERREGKRETERPGE